MKKVLFIAATLTFATIAFAQSGTNSPYSQYGLGTQADPTAGFNRGMNGLAYGFREHNQVNFANPASYSAVDSLSFIFDMGMSLQMTNFEEYGHKKNANNADFEYAVATFRAAKHVGVSFGILPFTNVGYNYSNTENVNAFPSTSSANATYTNTYSGSGGLHEVYLGAGWQPFKGFSFGANFGYLWGDYTRTVTNSYSDSYVNTLSKIYSAELSSYKLDVGAQIYTKLSKNDQLTLGLTYSYGHELSGDPQCIYSLTNSQNSSADHADTLKANGRLTIPHTFGAGLTWNHNNQLKLGFDYQMQKWSSVDWPSLNTSNANQPSYNLVSGQFNDRQKFTFGGEYYKGERYRSFFSRIHYRAGVSYATPCVKINGADGPREISASVGVGIPIMNNYNNRSLLNISAQWVNMSAEGLLKENTFRINVGLTFNERWFAKFKVE